jgi:glycosyltransferase involved in cell wall biosynthesis
LPTGHTPDKRTNVQAADDPPPDTAAPKRALFIVITDYPGGAERVTFSLAAELSRRPGWEVEVKIVCSKRRDSFSKRMLPPSVRVSYGPAQNWYLSFPFLPWRLLLRRYDLVFTTHVYTNALLSLMGRMRLVHTNRLVVRESMSLFDRFAGLKARRFPMLYRAYGGEDLVITQTGYMANHVRPWLPPRSAAHLQALPNPINMEAVGAAASEELEPELRARLERRCNVLFCGRLVDFKRPEAALETFRIALGGRHDAQLIFLGDGPLHPALHRQAAEVGLADKVLFLGFRSNPYPIMAECQYGLVTSANEGFPNVVIEMMACGLKMVVITPCAGDLDQLSGVAVTNTHDVNEIAAALRSAVDSGEDRSEDYRRTVGARAVGAYLDRVIGTVGPATA